MTKTLIVDDDRYSRNILSRLLEKMDFEVIQCSSINEGLQTAQQGEIDLIFLDVYFPDGNSLDKLNEFLAIPNSPEIIVITGAGDPESAERALYSGAWDYIEKPINGATLRAVVSQALGYRQQYLEFSEAISVLGKTIIGQSPRIKYCTSMLLQAAAINASCLILGETGTGKEVFARALHSNSTRAKYNFVTIDCTNIPQPLAESIFFGHQKGAFTDAREHQEGLFTLSHNGTLFLDEIGDLPLSTQKSLLRVLQEKRFRPIGAKSEVASDFRVIAATNCDLVSMVNAGTFRKDLYYRLSALVIPLPPLRERIEDIELLMRHFVDKITEERNLPPKDIAPALLDAARNYPWFGNIRELINSINTALTHSPDGEMLDIYHMPLPFRIHTKKMTFEQKKHCPETSSGLRLAEQAINLDDGLPPLKQVRQRAVEDVEREYLSLLVEQTGGNAQKSCKISGLSRARFYELLKKYEICLH